MAQDGAFRRTPLTLIVEPRRAHQRDLEARLGANGFAVLKARTGREACRLLSRVRPDVVVVGGGEGDLPGVEICRDLRDTTGVRDSTPILLIADEAFDVRRRTLAHQAGAWAVLDGDVEASEMVAILETFIAAKHDADSAREASLVDPETGFYNIRGILRKASEITADSTRTGRPVACVVLGLNHRESGLADDRAVTDEFANAVRRALRGADAVGRLGEGDFVVVSPGTDHPGAARLAERLLALVDRTTLGRGEYGPPFRAGYYAVQQSDEDSMIPVDLLTRATLALRRAQECATAQRIKPYAR